MAVVHQSSATANGTSTSATFAKPTGTTAGDLLLAWFTYTGGVSAAPTGWTQLVAGPFDTFAYYKIAGGSEPASYTWTGTNQVWNGGVSRYSGVDNINPIDVAAETGAVIGGTSIVVPSVTTVTANAMLIGGASTSAGVTISPPSGFTERWERSGGNDVEHASGLQPAAGASGSKTWVLSTSNSGAGFLSALTESNPAQTVTSPAFVDTSTQVFQPAVIGNTAIVAGFVPSSAAVFAPTVSVTAGPQTVTPSFVGSSAQVFAPSLTQTGTLARVHAAHQSAISVVVDHEPL